MGGEGRSFSRGHWRVREGMVEEVSSPQVLRVGRDGGGALGRTLGGGGKGFDVLGGVLWGMGVVWEGVGGYLWGVA